MGLGPWVLSAAGLACGEAVRDSRHRGGNCIDKGAVGTEHAVVKKPKKGQTRAQDSEADCSVN